MPSSIFKYYLLPAGIAIIALILSLNIMPKVNLQYTGISQISRADAREIVDSFIEKSGINISDYYVDQYFLHDHNGIDFLTRTYGIEKTISMAKSEEIPLAYWQFTFYKNVPRDRQLELYAFRVSPTGKLIKFQHLLPDSASGAKLEEQQALEIAQRLASRWPAINFADYELKNASSVEQTNRTDHTFKYYHKTREYQGGHDVFQIQIAGNEVANVVSHFQEPDNFISESGLVGGANLLFNSISAIAYVILLLVSIVIFLQQYHAGLVSVRNGLKIGALIYVAYIIQAIFMWDIFGLGTQIGAIGLFHKKFVIFGFSLVTSILFIFLHIFTSWTAGDHIIRTGKLHLLGGIDGILNRRWISKNVGREIPIGIASGITIFAGIQILSLFLSNFTNAVPRLTADSLSFFSYKIIFIGALATIVFNMLFEEVVYRKFLITYLHSKYKNAAVAIIFSAIITAIIAIFFDSHHVFWPTYWSLLPYFFIALLQGFVFWRHGLLASMASNFVLKSLYVIVPLLSSAAVSYTITVYLFTALIFLALVFGLIALRSGKFITFARNDEPAHIRRIKEQTRMQKELEIAQKVQLGLLPKEKPQIEGFDIAGISYPALEVGGDYFDFISLEKGNLGIAIGDVSGKGVPAAIYMTLTKGILQSHAESNLSPKQVLSKVNSLMYRTIEKSWYVSMFYAVLDTDLKKLRFSRAGHNPAIIFHSDNREPQMLQPAGIGLGLEHGEVFTQTLVEGELQLSPGNTLVFYTDGFTEAMNENGDEFGEDRFLDILKNYSNGSAEGLLRHALNEVNQFAAKQPQHDDMTMVVLRVL
ncbi:MAG: CPBP family intramembrane metalloprotease [Calditrichaeota bacterium]|nr:MAG: CPBP family intramembrane metalloprotease [Calditrichota bacterium]